MSQQPDVSVLPWPPLGAPPPATPVHTLHPELLGSRLALVQDSFPGRTVRFAYSLKTNPDPRMIRSALALGMDMEAITQAEAMLALREGARLDQLVLNGPGKWWPRPASVSCRSLFVNDLTELDVVQTLRADGMHVSARTLGVRLTTRAMGSRFGIAAEDHRALALAAGLLKPLMRTDDHAWGVHVHHAQSACGTDAWVERCAHALAGARVLAEELGTPPRLVDFGGGWRSCDLEAAPGAAREAAESEPDLLAASGVEWEFEFGKGLVEPLGVVYSRVLMPPDRTGAVIVDAGMGDMFEGMVSPHRTFVWRDEWVSVPEGTSTIFGRTCVEHDVLVRNLDTSSLRFGDVLAFADAGAYDVALSFDFTNGRVRSGWFT